jgi:acid phosphatase type 7
MRTLFSLLLISLQFIAAAQISRGPYLQAGTDTSMVIRWRTATASLCALKYGTDFNAQNSVLNETSSSTEHELKATSLQAFTKYFYSVYDGGTKLAGDSSFYFITNPVAGTVQPVHCWVIGDMGRANQDQMDVRNTYWNSVRNNRHTDVWLWTGDNVYSSGTDQEYQDKMFNIYPEILRNTVARPCPGNHDYQSVDAGTHDGPYYQNFTMPKDAEAGGAPSNEEGYYSFDYGNVHFISLNSENLAWYISSTSAMANWLRADLVANTQPFVIAYWHQPPYSRGSHDSDGAFSQMYFMRTNINPILEQYGADLVLNGHSHNYERSFLINGHYGNANTFSPLSMMVSSTSGKLSAGEPYTKYTTGPNANRGTVYTVVGNSGSSTTGASLDHPVMYYDEQGICGFLTIDVNGLQLDAKYYDQTGALKDEFTIIKSAQNPNGIKSLDTEITDLNIYPNPFSTDLKIEVNMLSAQHLQIELLDIQGKVVTSIYDAKMAEGKTELQVNTETLSKGNYLVRIKNAQLGIISRMVTLH